MVKTADKTPVCTTYTKYQTNFVMNFTEPQNLQLNTSTPCTWTPASICACASHSEIHCCTSFQAQIEINFTFPKEGFPKTILHKCLCHFSTKTAYNYYCRFCPNRNAFFNKFDYCTELSSNGFTRNNFSPDLSVKMGDFLQCSINSTNDLKCRGPMLNVPPSYITRKCLIRSGAFMDTENPSWKDKNTC